METCILCGDDLQKEKTNLEHYLPQVMIRNFDKLAVPQKFKYAERVNKHHTVSDEHIVCPIKQHKKWATIRVHERCNLDASPMCRDMRKVIDFLDNRPEYAHVYTTEDPIAKRIIEYYAAIWGNDPDHVRFAVTTYKSARDRMNSESPCMVYRPYEMSCGRFQVYSLFKGALREEHRHHIYFRENQD